MEQKIKSELLKVHKKWRTREAKRHKEWLIFLDKKYPNISLKEQIFLLFNNMSGRPICAVSGCNNEVVFKDTWYPETCSYSCSNTLRKEIGKLESIQEKAKILV